MSTVGGTLTPAQVEQYRRVGAIVVPNLLSKAEVDELRRETDRFVEESRAVSRHDDVSDLEETHTRDAPRVRRVKQPHLLSAAFAALIGHPAIVVVLTTLLGPDVRFDVSKLNMKSAAYGAPVEWHQDWAFYPHTNDDLLAAGVMLDDMELDNGPLLIVPGSHTGPVFDHHSDGRFCGAMDPARCDADFTSAIPLTGPAGSVSFHHVRAVHGSAPNASEKDRRLFLIQYRAADAWPLVNAPATLEAYDALMVAGSPRVEPRLSAAPVRLPLPPADWQGSIYENQKGLARRYFQPAKSKIVAR